MPASQSIFFCPQHIYDLFKVEEKDEEKEVSLERTSVPLMGPCPDGIWSLPPPLAW